MRTRVASIALLACLGGATPGVTGAQAAELSGLSYALSGVPAGSTLDIRYDTGVDGGVGGTAQFSQGAARNLFLLENALLLTPASGNALTGQITHYLMVGSAPVTGVATVPAGATVRLSNGLGRTISLSTGPFTIPSGVPANAAPLPSTPLAVTCTGTAASCQARVNVAGGASGRALSVALPASGMYLASKRATPSPRRAVHSLSGSSYSADRRTHTLRLHAARANPKGARVVLTYKRRR